MRNQGKGVMSRERCDSKVMIKGRNESCSCLGEELCRRWKPTKGVCLDQVSSVSALFILRAGDFFVVGTVLCFVGYLAEPPASTH